MAIGLAVAGLAAGPEPGRAADRVYPSAAEVEPLGPGAAIPTAQVRTVQGEPVALSSLVRENGALLVFYRGGW